MQDTNTFRFKIHACIRHAVYWIRFIRRQEISKADNHFGVVISMLESVLSYEEARDIAPTILDIFQAMMEMYQNRDYILTADYLEEGILPILRQKAEEIVQTLEAPSVEPGYLVEYTSSATTTIAKEIHGKMRYLHSNGCPLEEADEIANCWEEKGIDRYIVVGLGLGYHAVVLSRNPLVQVDVYEEDEKMIELAKEWCDTPAGLWEKDNINIIHDPDYQKFAKVASETEEDASVKICLYHPSICTIRKDALRGKMQNLFLQMDNSARWAEFFRLNFKYNTTNITHEIGELKASFEGKTVYLVAGGPSLDKNISLLKERDKDAIVLTVGTSLRRCLQEDIKPEYAIITDPKVAVHAQIKGIEDCGIPMILLSTTYAWIARDYTGEKYIACQEGYRDAEKLAEKNKWNVLKTGGSVITTAVDLCIQFGVEKLVFLGLDLAFTGGRTHQGDVGAKIAEAWELQVPDINGNLVGTSKNLNLYREWIERRIAEAKREGCATEFVDATEGGARVEGTMISTLKEFLDR